VSWSTRAAKYAVILGSGSALFGGLILVGSDRPVDAPKGVPFLVVGLAVAATAGLVMLLLRQGR
jgi:hypothetical protein